MRGIEIRCQSLVERLKRLSYQVWNWNFGNFFWKKWPMQQCVAWCLCVCFRNQPG
jgi:hypothetical protein